ncbi:hypothetical protein EDD85DRAFT_271133 [Armillaria nabsnona]|nr:hypothetical protein EDD85DRAFT_271133 [Armillaria nabsnona]
MSDHFFVPYTLFFLCCVVLDAVQRGKDKEGVRGNVGSFIQHVDTDIQKWTIFVSFLSSSMMSTWLSQVFYHLPWYLLAILGALEKSELLVRMAPAFLTAPYIKSQVSTRCLLKFLVVCSVVDVLRRSLRSSSYMMTTSLQDSPVCWLSIRKDYQSCVHMSTTTPLNDSRCSAAQFLAFFYSGDEDASGRSALLSYVGYYRS